MTNKFAFTCPHTYTWGLSANGTMNNCLGFLNGIIGNSYTAQTGTSTTISLTITSGVITITLNQTYLFNFTDHTGTNISFQIPPPVIFWY